MAPVAPDRADIQQNWFVVGAGARECVFSPFVPRYRLMRGGAKVRTGGIREAAAVFDGMDLQRRQRQKNAPEIFRDN